MTLYVVQYVPLLFFFNFINLSDFPNYKLGETFVLTYILCIANVRFSQTLNEI